MLACKGMQVPQSRRDARFGRTGLVWKQLTGNIHVTLRG